MTTDKHELLYKFECEAVCIACTAAVAGNITEDEETDEEELIGDVVRPNNTVVVVGERVEIPCRANADNESRWDYYSYQHNAVASVYNGDKVRSTFQQHSSQLTSKLTSLPTDKRNCSYTTL